MLLASVDCESSKDVVFSSVVVAFVVVVVLSFSIWPSMVVVWFLVVVIVAVVFLWAGVDALSLKMAEELDSELRLLNFGIIVQ